MLATSNQIYKNIIFSSSILHFWVKILLLVSYTSLVGFLKLKKHCMCKPSALTINKIVSQLLHKKQNCLEVRSVSSIQQPRVDQKFNTADVHYHSIIRLWNRTLNKIFQTKASKNIKHCLYSARKRTG